MKLALLRKPKSEYENDGSIRWYIGPGRTYSPRELVADFFVLGIGVVIAVSIAVLLSIQQHQLQNDAWEKQSGVILFIIGMLWSILASTFFHTMIGVRRSWAKLLIVMDGIGIYLLVAGSVSTALIQAKRHIALALVWAGVALGAVELIWRVCTRPESELKVHSFALAVLCFLMCFSWTLVGTEVDCFMKDTSVLFLVSAMAMIAVGFVFLHYERLEFHIPIWHSFVNISFMLVACGIYINMIDHQSPGEYHCEKGLLHR